MSENFSWDPSQNDDESFGDRPVEMENGKWQDVQLGLPPPTTNRPAPQRQAAPPVVTPVVPVEAEEPRQDASEEEEEDYTAVLTDARLRLEQGRLYEMLMNNNLFQDLEVDPKAVKFVERKVKNFAKEQMEIMLGMRQDPKIRTQSESIVSSPFNDLEVEALKALASTATKGATQLPEAQTFTPRPSNKKVSLTPIGPRKGPSPKALPSKAAAPIERKQNNAVVDQILAEEGVTREELEATFPSAYKPINKPLEQLTEEEKAARIRETAKRIKTAVKSTSALPMPDQEQVNAMVMNRVQQAASNPNMITLMKLLENRKT